MKLKKVVAVAACAAALLSVSGVAYADNLGPGQNDAGTPSYSGSLPSTGGDSADGYTPSYDWHAPSAGYTDGTESAPVSLGAGVTVNVIGYGGDIKTPQISDTQASNTQLNDGWLAPASKSLVVEPTSYRGATSAKLIFNLGDKYEGAEVKVFAQHQDGTTDVYNGTKVSNKISTVEISKFSVFTVAVKPAPKDGANKSLTSPNTAVTVEAVADFLANIF